MANLYSPLTLMILLHYHTTPKPYAEHEPAHADSPAVREAVNKLIQEDMIEPRNEPGLYRTSGRAAFFIEHLMNIPFPEQCWVIPDNHLGGE